MDSRASVVELELECSATPIEDGFFGNNNRCETSDAIEAAVEILATVQIDEQVDNTYCNTCNETKLALEDTAACSPTFVTDQAERIPEAVITTRLNQGTSTILADELARIGDTLRTEFRNSVAELQAAQAAAQSDILRALTEIVYQSSASAEVSPESLERALAGFEERLLSRLDRVNESVNPELPKSSVTAKPTAPVNSIKLQKAASSVTRSWEQIRNEMMTSGEIPHAAGSKEDGCPTEQLPAVAQLTSDRHFRLPEQDPSLEVPKAVDPETLSDAALRDAFREREAFIATLIARIRRQQELATGQLSQEQLRVLVTELPDELASQVQHTLKQMDDLARMAELELSLERARIARQVNQLEHSRQIIGHNARQLGMQLNPDGSIAHAASQPVRSSSSRRWLGKLGFGQ